MVTIVKSLKDDETKKLVEYITSGRMEVSDTELHQILGLKQGTELPIQKCLNIMTTLDNIIRRAIFETYGEDSALATNPRKKVLQALIHHYKPLQM